MNDSILVTGATGFVGTHLVQALRQRGDSVVAHSTRHGNLAREEPKAIGIRHVYHLAARTYVPDSWKDPRSFYEANVLGALNVLEFCRKHGCSLTLMSSYVYGRPERLPLSEDHPLRAFNPYAHSKILSEEMARFYEAAYNVRVNIVRPFNIYGPMQSGQFLIPTLISQALSKDRDAIIVQDADPKRDYIFVADLIDLLLLLDDSRNPGVYNAGSGVSTSVQELAEEILRLTRIQKRILSRDCRRPDEILNTVADITRARDILNWRPKISLQEGLLRTIAYMRSTVPGEIPAQVQEHNH
jgi:nucleoside-diphosphate-sugar epimerase